MLCRRRAEDSNFFSPTLLKCSLKIVNLDISGKSTEFFINSFQNTNRCHALLHTCKCYFYFLLLCKVKILKTTQDNSMLQNQSFKILKSLCLDVWKAHVQDIEARKARVTILVINFRFSPYFESIDNIQDKIYYSYYEIKARF